jgi:CRP/FNR family transcriptional regulator, anaerobic regulatory protein
MIDTIELEKFFNHFGQELISKIPEESVIKDFPKNTELIREGQYVKIVPIVSNRS